MVERLENSTELQLFIKRMKKKDMELYIHCHNVAVITKYILDYLNYNETVKVEVLKGALVHDIGKLCVRPDILKKEGALTYSEKEAIKSHPKMGLDYIKSSRFSEIVCDIVLHHHENEVGTGYPYHMTMLEKETVIVSLADKYEAIYSKRPYKQSHSHEETIKIMRNEIKKYRETDEIMKALELFNPAKYLLVSEEERKDEMMVAFCQCV